MVYKKNNTVTTGSLVIKTEKLFNKENRTLLISLVLFAIGAGISIFSSGYIENADIITDETRDTIRTLSIIKIVFVVIRLFISRKLGSATSGFTIFINLLIILITSGATTIETINDYVNNIQSLLGFETDFWYENKFYKSLQIVDFWIHIIGGVNTLAPLPSILNSILGMSVMITQTSM